AGASLVGAVPSALARPLAPAAAAAKRDALVVAASGPVLGLNLDRPDVSASGASFQVGMTLYDQLLEAIVPPSFADAKRTFAKGTTNARPLLARSWETSRTGLVRRFHLRPNVRSDAGNTLSAEDVVWSFAKILHAKGTSAFVISFLGGIADPKQVKAIDPLTV